MELKLGEKIKSLRKEKNISQEVLVQYLGVTFQAVSKWENGEYELAKAALEQISAWKETGRTPRPCLWQ